MPEREQFVGCLLGVAVGDALGFPVEGLSLERIREKFGPNGVQDFVTVGLRGAPLGTYSDDTQLTLAVARALLAAGRQPLEQLMEALCREYLAWYRSPEMARGPGWATLDALGRLAHGRSWMETGVRDSKGCGAAMRVAPIGLYYYREPETLCRIAELSALVTHKHPTGVAAAVANAYAVARALERVPPRELYEDVLRLASLTNQELLASLAEVNELDGVAPPLAFARLGETGSAEEVFASAMFCFLRSPDDFRATVLAAANSSGDSDSIAAMAGALSGAHNGVAAIPEKWRREVENAAEIERLAGELFAHATAEQE